MKKLIGLFIWLSLASGVIAGHWFDVAWAGNLAFAGLWFVIACYLICCLFDKVGKSQRGFIIWVVRFVVYFTLFLLFAAGWFVTGFSLLFIAIWSYALRTAEDKKADEPCH